MCPLTLLFFSQSRGINHPNVVMLYGYTHDPVCLVTEWVNEGDLFEYLQKNKSTSMKQRVKMAIDICNGLRWLHSKNVIHRDLKTSNLLVSLSSPFLSLFFLCSNSHNENISKITSNLVVKIADFGLAKLVRSSKTTTNAKGTPAFMAPEAIDPSKMPPGYDYRKLDIFSFAIVLWEVFTGESAFAEYESAMAVMFAITNGKRPPLPQNLHPRLKNVIEECWNADPQRRPPLDQVHSNLESTVGSL
jgi:serine/threonine protein kinase